MTGNQQVPKESEIRSRYSTTYLRRSVRSAISLILVQHPHVPVHSDFPFIPVQRRKKIPRGGATGDAIMGGREADGAVDDTKPPPPPPPFHPPPTPDHTVGCLDRYCRVCAIKDIGEDTVELEASGVKTTCRRGVARRRDAR